MGHSRDYILSFYRQIQLYCGNAADFSNYGLNQTNLLDYVNLLTELLTYLENYEYLEKMYFLIN